MSTLGAASNALALSDADETATGANAAVQIGSDSITGLAGNAGGSTITYRATGGNLTGGLAITGSASVSVHEGYTVSDPAGPFSLGLGPGDDAVVLRSSAFATTVAAGAGNDTLTLDDATGSLEGFRAPMTLDGGTGANTLALTDSGDGSADIVTLTANQIGAAVGNSLLGPGGTVTYSNWSSVSLATGSGSDVIAVTSTAAGAAVSIMAGPGNDVITMGDGAGSVGGIVGPVTIDGDIGFNSLTVDDSSDETGDRVALSNDGLGAEEGDDLFGQGGSLGYAGFTLLTLTTGTGPDTIDITGTPTALIALGAGSDRVLIADNAVLGRQDRRRARHRHDQLRGGEGPGNRIARDRQRNGDQRHPGVRDADRRFGQGQPDRPELSRLNADGRTRERHADGRHRERRSRRRRGERQAVRIAGQRLLRAHAAWAGQGDRPERSGRAGLLRLVRQGGRQPLQVEERATASAKGRSMAATARTDRERHREQFNDRITGSKGKDVLLGKAGNDRLTGLSGNGRLDGGGGKDKLIETADTDFTLTPTRLKGLGKDKLKAFESAALTGGDGHNVLSAQRFRGRVLLRGGLGDDTLEGGRKGDLLIGEDGDDTLIGGNGKDQYVAGGGTDTLLMKDRTPDRADAGDGYDRASFDTADRLTSVEGLAAG